MTTKSPRYNSLFLSRIKSSADRLGVEFDYLDSLNGCIALVRQGSRVSLFGAAPVKMWPFNSAISASICGDKELSLRLLGDEGVIVPRTTIGFSDSAQPREAKRTPSRIREMIRGESFPVVIKPNSSQMGRGLSVVHEESSLEDAVDISLSYGNAFLVQQYIPGRDFRIYALRGHPIVLIERSTWQIGGDGKRTVSELVNSDSRLREQLTINPPFKLSLDSFILRYGDIILPSGEPLEAYPVSNLAQGGKPVALNPKPSSIWLRLCEKIYKALTLDFFAADCRVYQSLPEQIYALEVNSNPGIEALYIASTSHADDIVDYLVREALQNYSSLEDIGK